MASNIKKINTTGYGNYSRVVATWDYKASYEYDGMPEKSYTCTSKGALSVSIYTESSRGSAHYIKKNNTEVSYQLNRYGQYGSGILFACFNVNKNDVIKCKPYQSDTGATSCIRVCFFSGRA